ncbi:hypothetical protein PANDA_021136 [Ailuropoda melanoleuca]|uniref:Uncharacterized protein n=1 Tax=Ailuropoda melanoleuca TaxID=9646 RepID=D2I5Y6_AILME|nr:hypothetical protein PANDA_021136 [Ailuropoda melanoleuca]
MLKITGSRRVKKITTMLFSLDSVCEGRREFILAIVLPDVTVSGEIYRQTHKELKRRKKERKKGKKERKKERRKEGRKEERKKERKKEGRKEGRKKERKKERKGLRGPWLPETYRSWETVEPSSHNQALRSLWPHVPFMRNVLVSMSARHSVYLIKKDGVVLVHRAELEAKQSKSRA